MVQVYNYNILQTPPAISCYTTAATAAATLIVALNIAFHLPFVYSELGFKPKCFFSLWQPCVHKTLSLEGKLYTATAVPFREGPKHPKTIIFQKSQRITHKLKQTCQEESKQSPEMNTPNQKAKQNSLYNKEKTKKTKPQVTQKKIHSTSRAPTKSLRLNAG